LRKPLGPPCPPQTIMSSVFLIHRLIATGAALALDVIAELAQLAAAST
jgi:hypothetical protein